MTFDLGLHVARLLEDEPFFAALSRHIEKYPSNQLPTAGVRVNPDSGRFELAYNPEFLEQMTEQEVKILLFHEFYIAFLDSESVWCLLNFCLIWPLF